MQRITLEELKHILFYAFRDHLTMKDIENIIINEEESLKENSGNCQTEFEGGEQRFVCRQWSVRVIVCGCCRWSRSNPWGTAASVTGCCWLIDFGGSASVSSSQTNIDKICRTLRSSTFYTFIDAAVGIPGFPFPSFWKNPSSTINLSTGSFILLTAKWGFSSGLDCKILTCECTQRLVQNGLFFPVNDSI